MTEKQDPRDVQRLALLEAVLFAATKPMSIEELRKLSKFEEDKIKLLITLLRIRYQDPKHGITLSEMGGYRLVVKHDYLDRVQTLTKSDLSKGLLRVLSIIAYHEPVKQSDIVKIIGNRTYEYVKHLGQFGFIKFERKSKTKLLSTTPQFESYFSVNKEQLKKALAQVEASQPQKEELHEEAAPTKEHPKPAEIKEQESKPNDTAKS